MKRLILGTRKEDELYYQGPFWLISDSLSSIVAGNFELVGHQYLSTYDGGYVGNDAVLSKSARTHRRIWREEYAEQYSNSDYAYYPRGRVAISNGVAYIHINSRCNVPNVINRIKSVYQLAKLTIQIDENDTFKLPD